MGQKLAGSSPVALGTHPLAVKLWLLFWWPSLPLSQDLIPKCRAGEATAFNLRL